MADESSVAAGKRFSRDMRLIREDREITIDDIHKETRISRTLIESFEQGGLYEHPTFNEVYLRSFVQAYAEAVGISTHAALDGLDAALDGVYEKSLADQFIGRPLEKDEESSSDSTETGAPEPSPAEGEETDHSSSPPTAGGPEGRGGIVGPPRALQDQSDTVEESEADAASEESSSQTSESGEDASPTQDSPDQEASSREEPHEQETSPHSKSLRTSSDRSDAASPPTPDSESVSEAEKASDVPDPDDQSESDDESEQPPDPAKEGVPSWMDDESDQEEEADSASGVWEESVPASETSDSDGASPPEGAPGETGIVGEPTAVGGEEVPPAPARPGSSTAAPNPGSRRRSGWLQFLRGEKREMIWAGIGFVVVLLVLVGLGIAYFSTTTSPEETVQSEPVSDTSATSTAQEDTTTTSSRPPPANVTLGDTIYLTVLATGPVSGLRVQRDEDLKRPYWIEEGEAEVYPFQQRVAIENELEDVRLFLAGYPFPVERQNTTGQVVIDRSQVEAFVDTLRGAPAKLSVTPDTIPKGPPPSIE